MRLLGRCVLLVLLGAAAACRMPLDYPDDPTHKAAKDRRIDPPARVVASKTPTPMPLSTPSMRCLGCHDPEHYVDQSQCVGACHAE